MLDKMAQLKVRTEYSFGRAFGPLTQVTETLAKMGCPAAAITDPETWGHVRWAEQCKQSGVAPLFGTTVTVPRLNGKNPTATALAVDTRAFYRFSSAIRQEGEGVNVAELILGRQGVVILAGGAFTASERDFFDYVDLWPADRITMRRRIELAKEANKPLVLTSDNYYPAPEHRSAFLAMNGRDQLTPQHLMSATEMADYMQDAIGELEFMQAYNRTNTLAATLATELQIAPMIHLEGDLYGDCRAGQQHRLQAGHIKEWTPEHERRLMYELDIIGKKDFESYFNVVSDLVKWAKGQMLVGPARGSSGGSLVCYVLGITEIDPIHHGLLFERFIDMTRADLPDIDIDFSDRARDEVFTYLENKYGRQNVARLGSVNTMKPRSALVKTLGNFGIMDKDRFALAEVIDEGIQNAFEHTQIGREFIEKYPAAAIIAQVEGHASHSGVHAAGVIVCNEPVTDFCTVGAAGIAQIDKPDAENLNLLKIDALGLKTLGVIEDTGVVTADELYALPLDDEKVFNIINSGKFSGIFQFEGATLQGICASVPVHQFKTMDHLTALARPGPLQGGAAQHYIDRSAGRRDVEYLHPLLEPVLNDTFGILLYQEQVMIIARDIGNFDIADTTRVRKAISNKKGAAFADELEQKFIAGAIENGMPRDTAAQVWQEMVNFGGYGMNRAHTCAYSVVSYWCAWLKAYHPLHYAAAVLRGLAADTNADVKTLTALREIVAEGVRYKAFDLETSQVNWSVQNGALVGGFMNLAGFGLATATEAVKQRDAAAMTDKMLAKIDKAKVKYADLFPLQAEYADLIADPYMHGCARGSRVDFLDSLPDRGSVLLVCQVEKKQLRNKNEAALLQRRGGKRESGETDFVDIRVTDDTGGPFLVRIEPDLFNSTGKKIMDGLELKKDVILIRGQKLRNLPMVKAEKIKCLTNTELL